MIKEPRTNAEAKIPADFFVNDLFRRLIVRNPRRGKTGISQTNCDMQIFFVRTNLQDSSLITNKKQHNAQPDFYHPLFLLKQIKHELAIL